MKIETRWFYFSYKKGEGFYLELGNVDKSPTTMFTVALTHLSKLGEG